MEDAQGKGWRLERVSIYVNASPALFTASEKRRREL
jgi:hypothetical protein